MNSTRLVTDPRAKDLLDIPNAYPEIDFPLDAFPPQISAWIESTTYRLRTRPPVVPNTTIRHSGRL